MYFAHLWFLSLWTFKGQKNEKGPFTPPHDSILRKMVGLMSWQQTLDKICHSVGPLNYLETVIHFVMTI